MSWFGVFFTIDSIKSIHKWSSSCKISWIFFAFFLRFIFFIPHLFFWILIFLYNIITIDTKNLSTSILNFKHLFYRIFKIRVIIRVFKDIRVAWHLYFTVTVVHFKKMFTILRELFTIINNYCQLLTIIYNYLQLLTIIATITTHNYW